MSDIRALYGLISDLANLVSQFAPDDANNWRSELEEIASRCAAACSPLPSPPAAEPARTPWETKPPKPRVTVRFIVNGEDTAVVIAANAPLHVARYEALLQTRNWSRPPEDWEIHSLDGKLVTGLWRDAEGFTEKLFLTLRVGQGASSAPSPPAAEPQAEPMGEKCSARCPVTSAPCIHAGGHPMPHVANWTGPTGTMQVQWEPAHRAAEPAPQKEAGVPTSRTELEANSAAYWCNRCRAAERERDEANAESLRRLTARQEAEATVDRLRGLLRDAMGLTFPESQPQDYGDFCDARRKWIAEARRELGGGGARDAGACPTCGRSCNCQPDTCPTCGGTGRKP